MIPFALPFAIPAVLMAWMPIAATLTLILGAAGANLWFDLTDWRTFAIAAGAGAVALAVGTSGSPWARLGLVVVLVVATNLKTHVDATAKRDAWWRAQIAASSAKAGAILQNGSEEAVATDEDVIAAIRGTDAELASAEKRLADAKRLKVERACLLPAHCLGSNPGAVAGALGLR